MTDRRKGGRNCSKHLAVQKKMITFADDIRAFFGIVKIM